MNSANRPFFSNCYKNGKLQLNIDPCLDYCQANKVGKAGVYDYVRYLCESDYTGGNLQGIAYAFTDKDTLNDAEKGFLVGFFSTLEGLIRNSYAHPQVRESITSKGLNVPPVFTPPEPLVIPDTDEAEQTFNQMTGVIEVQAILQENAKVVTAIANETQAFVDDLEQLKSAFDVGTCLSTLFTLKETVNDMEELLNAMPVMNSTQAEKGGE
ncbi:hypothetical protein [Thiomicrorhabdus xiamenensis]|uniref:Uncharacterized protein n=1 Tax=Thiomicrorhabdus xiamenensis TaxID=2739063 RepID=A0A7D4P4G8_9GAMM|nr:hypothetical protein [Thiomicrorhabdus xiamenensis]QKI89216.1 hypothetical protein HQN79_06385 [Thiomicrorhabdus xiamenensis]